MARTVADFIVETVHRAGAEHVFGVAEAAAHPGPVVVDVVTNPNEVALPPAVTASDVWGFSIAKLKEFVTSRGDGPKGAA